jgi:hypothetical protein
MDQRRKLDIKTLLAIGGVLAAIASFLINFGKDAASAEQVQKDVTANTARLKEHDKDIADLKIYAAESRVNMVNIDKNMLEMKGMMRAYLRKKMRDEEDQ